MSLADDPIIWQIRKVVQRIALMSHAPTQSYNVVLKGDDVPPTPQRWRTRDVRPPMPHLGTHSGKSGDTAIPRGGISRYDDAQFEFRQKSHVYFERKLNRIVQRERSTTADLERLLEEAQQALEDWQKTPVVRGVEPERGSFAWKCMVADDNRPLEMVKQTYSLSKATIYRYRSKYRGLRRGSVAA